MLNLLLTYKYLILIPLSIIEGPIVTVIAGFLVTLKVFNPFVVYIVMVIGDITGDGILYYIGFSGKRFLKYLKVTDEKMEIAKEYFKENHHKAMFISKLAHGIGFTGLLAAGAVHVPYRKYFQTCGSISVVQSLLMLILGILFGHAYVAIGKYLDYYAAISSLILLIIISFMLINKYKIKLKI